VNTVSSEERHKLRHQKRMDELHYKQKKRQLKSGAKVISCSKVIVTFLVLLIIEVVIYAEIIMWRSEDISSLYALIGGTATACVAAVIEYLWKTGKENSSGGIVYETAMNSLKRDEPDGCCEDETVPKGAETETETDRDTLSLETVNGMEE